MSYQDKPLGDFLGFVDRVVTTINAALVNIPRDRVRLHVCWGNYEGPHDCDVELQEIMPILRKLNVGGFVLPFANPRHAHEYAVLRDFPLDPDQVIVAGVIDSVTNFVEHPKTIAERIERVAEAVGDPKRVLAGTDCGFDTSAGPASRGRGRGLGEAGGAQRRRTDRVGAAVLTGRTRRRETRAAATGSAARRTA